MATLRQHFQKIKETSKQKKNLRPFKNYNYLTPAYRKKQEATFAKLLKSVYETAQEKKLYSEYVRIVKESFKKDNHLQKFSLEHVERLGINWDILFLYSKKDVGKTWAVSSYVTRLLEAHPWAQIAFIRNSKEEAKGFIEMMNTSENGPTYTNGELVFKKTDVRRNKGKITGLRPCGIFAYASGAGFTRGQGGDGGDLRFGYWDECNSVQGGLTEEVFKNLNVFLSSMIRDKEGSKRVVGIMTGNLLDKNNIFLERLGVGSKTNLKIFEIHKDKDKKKQILSRLLYLNTGDLFKGIEEQKGLATQFLTDDEFAGLLSNRPGVYSHKAQYEQIELRNFIPRFAFVFRDDVQDVQNARSIKVDYVAYIYSIPNSVRGVLGVERFNQEQIKPGFRCICSNDKLISNRYSMVVPVEEPEDFGESYIEPLSEKMLTGELGYGGNGTEDVGNRSWPKLESKYLKKDTNEV